MRQFLVLMICAFAGSLAAEDIGDVEYHLPTNQEWKILDGLKDKGVDIPDTTRIYIPKTSNIENTEEAFVVEKADMPNPEIDQAFIEKMYEMKFPDQKAKINILEKTPESVLYEWSLKDGNDEDVHGWTRIFTSPEPVVLTYQTGKIAEVKDVGPVWLKVLKDAKVVKSAEAADQKTK